MVRDSIDPSNLATKSHGRIPVRFPGLLEVLYDLSRPAGGYFDSYVGAVSKGEGGHFL